MTDQPMSTPEDDTSTPPSENSPPLSSIPPSLKAPPLSENGPLMGDAPGGPEAPPPTISSPLRADLCRMWALGFLDCMKGEPVIDDDAIPSELVEPLVTLAEGCIDHAASFIAQVFTENPETIYSTVYGVGFEVCLAINLKAAAELNRN